MVASSIATILALVVAILAWLAPFGEVGPSPLGRNQVTPTSSHSTTPPPGVAHTPATLTPTPTPIRAPTLHDSWTRAADGMEMVYVPAGEFQMGSDDDDVDEALRLCNQYYAPFYDYGDCDRKWFENEQPQHIVYLDGFWIDRTEVTNTQYRRCVETGACAVPQKTGSHTRDSYYGNSTYDDYPVIYVTWQGTTDYCAWVGARLPTEAEYEYAARGPEGRVFPWGNEFDGNLLNYCDASCGYGWADEVVDDGHPDTAPVGSYPMGVSWCGALDMVGNVWEWVADLYDTHYYEDSPYRNPTGPSSGMRRVLRGGSWDDVPCNERGARRYGPRYDPVKGYYNVGLRCAMDSE